MVLEQGLSVFGSKEERFEQDIDKTPKKKEELLALIRQNMERIVDSHRNFVDQQTAQMKWLAININDDFGVLETANIVGLELEKNRAVSSGSSAVLYGEQSVYRHVPVVWKRGFS